MYVRISILYDCLEGVRRQNSKYAYHIFCYIMFTFVKWDYYHYHHYFYYIINIFTPVFLVPQFLRFTFNFKNLTVFSLTSAYYKVLLKYIVKDN